MSDNSTNHFSSYTPPFTSKSDESVPPPPISGEVALWRAVILQALTDASSKSKKQRERFHKIDAEHWLAGNSKDFYDVCDYALRDPDYIRTEAKKALARGCKWRSEAGLNPHSKSKKPKPKKQQKSTELVASDSKPVQQFSSIIK